MHEEKVHEEEFDGFTIKLFFMPEDQAIKDCFDSNIDNIHELEMKVESGEYLWFVAHVTAFKEGILLGEDYLGACMYASVEDFIAEDGYYPDMRQCAVDQAKEKIKKLRGE